MNKTMIVYGPAACGKTYNAKRIAKHFGLKKIIDGWSEGSEMPPQFGALVLTNERPHGWPDSNRRIMSYAQVIKLIGA